MMRFRGFPSYLAGLLMVLTVAAGAQAEEKFNWDAWRTIVVQQGGRMKPLDTLAWEFVLSVTNSRGSLKPDKFFSVSLADIKDMSGFVESLRSAGKSDANPAAARVWNELSSKLRERLNALDFSKKQQWQQELVASDAEIDRLKKKHSKAFEIQTLQQLVDAAAGDAEVSAKVAAHQGLTSKLNELNSCESDLILELNDLVGWKDLYSEKAWPASSLTPEAAELVRKGVAKLNTVELQRLNSLLIHSAFPDTVAAMELGSTEAGTLTIEGRKYSAIELYLTWLLGWQGWDKVHEYGQLSQGARDDEIYWRFHTADVWDHLPLINARFDPLKPILKPETLTAVSARTIAANKEFQEWVIETNSKRAAQEIELSPSEEKGLDVFQAYLNYAQLRLGFNLQVGPELSEDNDTWVPLVALLIKNERIDQSSYDSATVEQIRQGFLQARRGLLSGNASEFNAGSQVFTDALAKLGKTSKLYPTQAVIAREVHYNSFQPFYKTTIVAFLAAVIIALSLSFENRLPYYVGFATLLAAIGLSAYGMLLRSLISGRGPVTNMYETLIWSAFFNAALAVVLALVFRFRIIGLVGAVTLGLGTLLAYNLPAEMGATITPLVPVLRSNYWLIVHVMTIVASYGAFMLAWALGNAGLGFYAFNVQDKDLHKRMGVIIYRAMQVGVLLLAAGTILGGWWAAESWGRFWGWDPKEVWALIALLLYLAILHARYAGWVKLFGLHAWTVVAFSGVVMAWYGVNFVLGAGLHAYAFGSGGRIYVVGCTLANLLFVVGVSILHAARKASGRREQVESGDDDQEWNASEPEGFQVAATES